MIDFTAFFKQIHGFEPFPWQRMLAEQVLERGRWPKLIDLPTASGKTACIDIAIWAMACQASLPPDERTMPRRIWFVVDRRIVVDEAAERAERIQRAIEEKEELAEVKASLYELAGTKQTPLAVARLRGGGNVPPDESMEERDERLEREAINDCWQTVPTQPAVLTSTVDQLGSRLLFRGYGMSPNRWPIHAALAGNDSLILLDEAHIAEPLRQTLAWVKHHREHAAEPVQTPWHFAFMSATPGAVDDDDPWPIFPKPEQREAALNHDLLHKRRHAAKPAQLVTINTGAKRDEKKVAAAVVEQVKTMLAKRRRIAVMLNRVDSALASAAALKKELAHAAGVHLLTGRMRPIDRGSLVAQLTTLFGVGQDDDGGGPPQVLVTTQCLEVGADFDFDGLVTECASLDALRQRFGRLNRLGGRASVAAVVMTCENDIRTDKELAKLDQAGEAADPIYGNALARAHQWLASIGDEVDFGIDALDAALAATPPADGTAKLLSPKRDAPVMMPAYLDAWCQTNPRPAVEAEVSLFLHGPQDDVAEVEVVFRADLPDALTSHQVEEVVRLCPPAPDEKLPVKLGRLRAWLTGKKLTADADIEGAAESFKLTGAPRPPVPRIVRYRGGQEEQIEVLAPDADLRPGDVLVVPLDGDMPEVLGSKPPEAALDRFDQANRAAGRCWIKRSTEDEVVTRVKVLLGRPEDAEGDDAEEKRHAARELHEYLPEDWRSEELPDVRGGWQYHLHPAGGVIIVWPPPDKPMPVDPFADADDSLAATHENAARRLDVHQNQVTDLAVQLARKAAPAFTAEVADAAQHHDDGKADARFQGLLRGESLPHVTSDVAAMLAKSEDQPSRTEDIRLRELLKLPNGWRHEMLSMQLVQQRDADAADLVLHLIASHHGHARCFAPVVIDKHPHEITIGGVTLTVEQQQHCPPHRIGSGVAERFWRLTRRHGWWGLAYLEAMVRLADQHVSRFPPKNKEAADA
jgi:CRISPR-associated endonuclease/helicase Cas3